LTLVPTSVSLSRSLSRQHVILGPTLIGLGYLPDFTPAHQLDFEIGFICKTCDNRKSRDSKGTVSKDLFIGNIPCFIQITLIFKHIAHAFFFISANSR
jgi:hypothetical protein